MPEGRRISQQGEVSREVAAFSHPEIVSVQSLYSTKKRFVKLVVQKISLFRSSTAYSPVRAADIGEKLIGQGTVSWG